MDVLKGTASDSGERRPASPSGEERRRPLGLVAALVALFGAGGLLLAPAGDTRLTAPTVQITSGPSGQTTETTASFTFTGTELTGFRCMLDNARLFTDCTSPTTYSGLTLGDHTFTVAGYRGDTPTGASETRAWTIVAPPPPSTVTITGGPAAQTTETSATFTFSGTELTGFRCRLDDTRELTPCTSPTTYTGLAVGSHTFTVAGYRGETPTGASDTRTWSVAAPPPPPGGGGGGGGGEGGGGDATQPGAGGAQPGGGPVLVVPDFQLVPATAPSFTRPGQTSKSATIVVKRIGGSKGGLALSHGALPAGVKLDAIQLPPGDPTAIAFTISASATAKQVFDAKVVLLAAPLSPAAGKATRGATITYSIVADYDLAVTGIEVTQGVHVVPSTASALPARDPKSPGKAVQYRNVVTWKPIPCEAPVTGPFPCLEPTGGQGRLVRGKTTVARVFTVVNPATEAIEGSRMPTVLLHGRTPGGTPLPGSPLVSQSEPSILAGDPMRTPVTMLRTGRGAFTFTLPASWVDRPEIVLEAEAQPKVAGVGECPTPSCAANNRFVLTNVKLVDTGFLNLWPVALTYGGDEPLPPPAAVFAPTGRLLPLGNLRLLTGGYRTTIDVTKIVNAKTLADALGPCLGCASLPMTRKARSSLMLGLVKAIDPPGACRYVPPFVRPASCPDVLVGVTAWSGTGVAAKAPTDGIANPGDVPSWVAAVVNPLRPLTSVAHEITHQLGSKHADRKPGSNNRCGLSVVPARVTGRPPGEHRCESPHRDPATMEWVSRNDGLRPIVAGHPRS